MIPDHRQKSPSDFATDGSFSKLIIWQPPNDDGEVPSSRAAAIHPARLSRTQPQLHAPNHQVRFWCFFFFSFVQATRKVPSPGKCGLFRVDDQRQKRGEPGGIARAVRPQLSATKRNIPICRSTPTSDGWFIPSITGTSAKSNGLIPRQAALTPYSDPFDRRR